MGLYSKNNVNKKGNPMSAAESGSPFRRALNWCWTSRDKSVAVTRISTFFLHLGSASLRPLLEVSPVLAEQWHWLSGSVSSTAYGLVYSVTPVITRREDLKKRDALLRNANTLVDRITELQGQIRTSFDDLMAIFPEQSERLIAGLGREVRELMTPEQNVVGINFSGCLGGIDIHTVAYTLTGACITASEFCYNYANPAIAAIFGASGIAISAITSSTTISECDTVAADARDFTHAGGDLDRKSVSLEVALTHHEGLLGRAIYFIDRAKTILDGLQCQLVDSILISFFYIDVALQ